MTRDELLQLLCILNEAEREPESIHKKADSALLEYINDEAITQAYNALEKWYG